VTDIDWLTEEFHPAALRLARANEKAFELAEAALAWSKGVDGSGAIVLGQVDRGGDMLDVVVTALRPVPPIAAMLFSEAIHHLRSAIDNVVFTTVERDHHGALTAKQVRRISMLISADAEAHGRTVRDLDRGGLPEFLETSELGARIARLQPFAETVDVHAVPPRIAELSGVPSTPVAHPLELLRDYSNADKHHNMRLAAGRVLAQRADDLVRSRKQGMRPIKVGTVLETVPKYGRTAIDVMPALHLLRPDGVTWVGPLYELDKIARHVANTVIPMLVTGSPMPDSLPVRVDLTDNGQTDRERLTAGTAEWAHDRGRAASASAYLDSLDAPDRKALLLRRDRESSLDRPST
jgi:hypothetical protein